MFLEKLLVVNGMKEKEKCKATLIKPELQQKSWNADGFAYFTSKWTK